MCTSKMTNEETLTPDTNYLLVVVVILFWRGTDDPGETETYLSQFLVLVDLIGVLGTGSIRSTSNLYFNNRGCQCQYFYS